MTVIPAKHTFTIWQGATFFEVLTLYETMDKTTPRDFCIGGSVTGLSVSTTSGNPSATLTGTNGLTGNTTYSISSSTIPASNNIYFTTPQTPVTGITLSSTTGVTTSSGSNAATITTRSTGYSAEMVLRDKPGGTPLKVNGVDLILSTSNNISSVGFGIILPVEPTVKGQIKLQINPSITQAITWKTAVYDLTIKNETTGVTDALLYGGIKVNGV